LLNTGGYARGLHLPGETGVAHFVFGRRCFFGYFIHPNGEVRNPPIRRAAGSRRGTNCWPSPRSSGERVSSTAIGDAIVLATCLRDLPDPTAAFTAFQKLRQERVERVVKYGKRSGDGKVAGRVGAKIRDLALPMIMGRMEASSSLGWLYDYRIEWSAPVTTGR